MTKNQFLNLLQRYLDGESSNGEQNLLHAYYDLFMADPDVLALLNSEEKTQLGLQIKQRIDTGITVEAGPFPWARIILIAAAVATVIFGVWFFRDYSSGHTLDADRGIAMRTEIIPGPSAAIPGKNDVAAGGKGATLKLTGGDSIFLSAVKSAVVIGEDLKYSDGSAVGLDVAKQERQDELPVESKASTGMIAFPMSISTGKGQTYQMVLADGTKVWLNAGSQLDFPSSFDGSSTRTVKFSGEGYFEVSPDQRHPFIVQSPSQQIEVLGTRFNLSDYGGQASAVTSLLEGSVQVNPVPKFIDQASAAKKSGDHKALVLKAGQQFVLNKEFQRLLKVDEKVVLAWKAGDFYFENESLVSVLEKIAYWYDVELIYLNEKPKEHISGTISRSVKLSRVLEVISSTGVQKFRIEGRKVYVE